TASTRRATTFQSAPRPMPNTGDVARSRPPAPANSPPAAPYASADTPNSPVTGFIIGRRTPNSALTSVPASAAAYGFQRGGWPMENTGRAGARGSAAESWPWIAAALAAARRASAQVIVVRTIPYSPSIGVPAAEAVYPAAPGARPPDESRPHPATGSP